MVIAVGDEGGFAPKIAQHEDVFKVILAAAQKAGYPNMALAIDCAASEFYKNNQYQFEHAAYADRQMTYIDAYLWNK